MYVMVTGADRVEGNATANVRFWTKLGTIVRFRGTTDSANGEDAIVVYKVHHLSGQHVFGTFIGRRQLLPEAAMPGRPDPIPALYREIYVHHYETNIEDRGTEQFDVFFAVYALNSTNSKQELKGYCRWDPYVTVA